MSQTHPYVHAGAVWNLAEVVAIIGVSQLGRGLNEEEVNKITGFLRTLTGEQPEVMYPTPPPSTAGTPAPQP